MVVLAGFFCFPFNPAKPLTEQNTNISAANIIIQDGLFFQIKKRQHIFLNQELYVPLYFLFFSLRKTML